MFRRLNANWFRIGGLLFAAGMFSLVGRDNVRGDTPPLIIGVPDYSKITGVIENGELPIEQPEVLWAVTSELKQPNGVMVSNSIGDTVYADGILYFGDDQGNLTALRVEDQSELWSFPSGQRISMTPSIDKVHVYFGNSSGITALKKQTGEAVWHFQMPHGDGETKPLPVGDHLYFSAYDGNSYCVNRMTGVLIWQHDFVKDAPPDPKGFEGKQARFQNILARPNGAACNGKLFIQCVFDQCRVIAVDCETGARCWSFQAEGWIGPAPTIANNRVYVPCQDEHLYCLDLDTGAVVWKFKTNSWLASRAAVHNGHVFLPHHGAKLFQLNAETGALIRTMEPPDEADRNGSVYSFPIISNKTAFFASGKGLFFAFDIETGDMRWKIRPSENSELFTNATTDGRQIFMTARPSRNNGKTSGESAIISIGIEK